MKSQLKYWLRWLLVIPGALIAGFLWNLIFYIGTKIVSVPPGFIFLTREFFRESSCSVLIITVGVYIAPGYPLYVAGLLGGVYIIFSLVSLLATLVIPTTALEIAIIFGGVIGPIYGIWYVWKKHHHKEWHSKKQQGG